MGSYRKRQVVSLNGMGFDVIIFDDGMVRIGCEIFHIREWFNFSDQELASMDAYALEFRNKWKDTILLIARQLGVEEVCKNE